MKKYRILMMFFGMILLLAGCAAEIRTVPFDVEDIGPTKNIAVASAYTLQSDFDAEEYHIENQFGFDGNGMLVAAGMDSGTMDGQLYTIDPETGVRQQILQSEYGKIEQLEILLNGDALIYVQKVRNENAETEGFKICMRRTADGKEFILAELSAAEGSVILADKMDDSGSEISYLWGCQGNYQLSIINIKTLQQRFFHLNDVIPQLMQENLTIKGLYQKDDSTVAGNILLGEKEYYWQANMDDIRGAETPGEPAEISGDWLAKNVRTAEIRRSSQIQTGKMIYYLAEDAKLYRMDIDTEIESVMAEGISRFCISGDEKTLAYVTEQAGVSKLYVDRIGDEAPVLVNVDQQVYELNMNEDGSRIAVSCFDNSAQRSTTRNIAVFRLTYSAAE